MVGLLLVVIWLAVLVPLALRKRADFDLSAAITRLTHRPSRSTGAFPQLVPVVANDTSVKGEVSAARKRRDRQRRHVRQLRRRRAVAVLLLSTAVTLVFGAIPALRVLWDLTLVLFLISCGYLGLLAYFTRVETLAAERDRKIVGFVGPVPIAPVVAEERLRASVGAPSAIVRRPAFVLVDRRS